MDLFQIAVVQMMKYSMEKAAKNAPSTAMAHFHIANAQETMFTMKKRMNAWSVPKKGKWKFCTSNLKLSIWIFELTFIETSPIEALVGTQVVFVNIHYDIERIGINAFNVHSMQRESFHIVDVLATTLALIHKMQPATNVQPTPEARVYHFEENKLNESFQQKHCFNKQKVVFQKY